MTLNQFIEELQFYAGRTMGAGNFKVKTFKKADAEQFICVFGPTEITVDYDNEEIHLWPSEGEE